jgi:hypothetical protein
MDWIQEGQDRVQWEAFVNVGSVTGEDFLTSVVTIIVSMRTALWNQKHEN